MEYSDPASLLPEAQGKHTSDNTILQIFLISKSTVVVNAFSLNAHTRKTKNFCSRHFHQQKKAKKKRSAKHRDKLCVWKTAPQPLSNKTNGTTTVFALLFVSFFKKPRQNR